MRFSPIPVPSGYEFRRFALAFVNVIAQSLFALAMANLTGTIIIAMGSEYGDR